MHLSDLAKYWESKDPYSNVALYDLDRDPSETTNLAHEYPKLVEDLLAEAEAAIKDAPSQAFTLVKHLTQLQEFVRPTA